DGFLYTSRNSSGDIFRVDVASLEAALFSTGPTATGNDGARCAIAPIPTDFGDAPDQYGTTLGSGGPRHGLGSPMLGSSIDSEADGQPSAAADSDGADDDGIASFPPLATSDTAYSVTVTCVGDGATVAGWIDFDRNQSFDADERTAALCSA